MLLPKVETHLHLDGALRPGVIGELAREQGYAPLKDKSDAEIAALTVVAERRRSLPEVLAAFHAVYPLLRRADAVERAAYEAAAGAAKSGALHAEVRFAPALQAAEGFSTETALRSALKGLERARAEHDLTCGLIVCLIRPFALVSRRDNEAMTELACAFAGRGVAGLDLAGDESASPLSDYADLFGRAKAAGLHLTAHAGEVEGSRDLETALDLGVDRLGHATLLARKPELLREVRDRGVTIEVNPTSNVRTSAVASYAAHPARAWFEAGVPLAVSTDDPGLFDIDLEHEYGLLKSQMGFSPRELETVARQGAESAFLKPSDKKALLERFDRALSK